ncbi:MAG: ABC transporter substrate-binding protein [Pseudomonadota bacterium]
MPNVTTKTATIRRKESLLWSTALLLGLMLLLLLPRPAMAEDGWPRTITDVNGYSVTLNAPSQRSAPLPPPLGTFGVAIPGAAERVVTVHPWSQTVMMQGTLYDYFPEVADIPTGAIGAGFVPNIEELLATDPDVVFQVGFMGQDVLDPIAAVGLPYLTINVTPRDDARDWIPMMGQVYGEEARAQAILDSRDAVQAQITEALADLPEADRPSVAHISAYGEQLRVVGGTHFRSWQIEMTGGVNVGADIEHRSQQINPEQLLAWDPDIILLHAFRGDEVTPQMIFDDPLLQDLSAVQTRQVYAFPVGGDRWEAPVAESPLGWMWLSELLHPEIFDWNIEAEIAAAHELLYGQTPRPEAYAQMLRVHLNEGSAGYDRYLDH